jgi:hypothetical protein
MDIYYGMAAVLMIIWFIAFGWFLWYYLYTDKTEAPKPGLLYLDRKYAAKNSIRDPHTFHRMRIEKK